MIELVKQIEPSKLHAWLETHVRQHLKPDVSNYAKGRLRVWLRTEPTLTSPTRLLQGLPMPDAWWRRMQDVVGWEFDYCLATYSGDQTPIGIGPHRDAAYADFEAWAVNVSGQCEFRYWEGRKAFGRAPNEKEFDPKRDDPTHVLIAQPGDVVRFNCKNMHSASPGTRRWNLNFWKSKP